jgi:hypothetical protein
MKIRNGFVSNSSSSSFIVGIAKIEDKEKFDKYIADNNVILDNYNNFIISYKDINESKLYDVRNFKNNISVDSFQTSASIFSDDFKDDDMFFITNIMNNEGDDMFYSNDEYDLDYDIDITSFDKNQQQIYNIFFDEKTGIDITKSVAYYGAGRNG